MRWAQLQILTWEPRHDFNFFFPSLLWCSLSSLEVIQMPTWDLGKKKKRFCWGFFWYLTNRRICNALGGGDWRRGIYFFFSFAPRRSHRQLCKEAGEEEWWQIHPGCPSSVPGEETAKSSGFGWPREGNGVSLVAALLVFARCQRAARSAGKLLLCGRVPKGTNTTSPLLHPAGRASQAHLCCCRSVATISVASAVASALIPSVVPILWHLFDFERSQGCFKGNFS